MEGEEDLNLFSHFKFSTSFLIGQNQNDIMPDKSDPPVSVLKIRGLRYQALKASRSHKGGIFVGCSLGN